MDTEMQFNAYNDLGVIEPTAQGPQPPANERQVRKMVRGHKAVDGAGVRLTRVLGNATVDDFDPFLMLDSFDSENPDDYIRGFPWHPHRGIETITYVIRGEIDHEDSLGNAGRIGPGQSQWMTAGSGILHQEMPQRAERLQGFQLWLNLPAQDKMTTPKYFDITDELIGEVRIDGGLVRVLSGEFLGVDGAKPHHIQATLYDVALEAGRQVTLRTNPAENVFVFLVEGGAVIGGQPVAEKTAVLFGEGETVTIAATEDKPLRFLFASGPPLREGIAWGGPIVMNTREELEQAFQDLDTGNFIRYSAQM